MITTKQIFESNQVLTLEMAQSLIGKKIAVTNAEYRGNTPSVRIGTLLSIESEWDLAGKEELDGGKFATRQDYWKSFMSEAQIDIKKSRLKLVSDKPLYATYSELFGYFFGSDEDRPVYFVIID